MKLKKITKPQFEGVIYYNPAIEPHKQSFEDWFEKEIEPLNKLIEGATEVYGRSDHPLDKVDFWSRNFEGNYKAYLIGIESIPKESAEDVLKEYLEKESVPLAWYERFKAALKREGE